MTSPARSAWDALWAGCAAYSAAGATVVHDSDVRWFATGVGYEGLNGVFIAPGTPAVPVEAARRTFHRMGVPALWHVAVDGDRPPAQPPGVSFYEEEPLLVTRLDRYELPVVDRLSIMPVAGGAGLREWVRLWSGRESGAVFEDTVRARSASGFTHLLAMVAGVPVGCAATFTQGAWGEVQHVVTVPEHRRRGIGTALTVAALRSIGAHGATTAVLTSSPDGVRIYRRLGFWQVGRLRRYLWSPQGNRSAARSLVRMATETSPRRRAM
ncbi:MAG TPA: GNAT family N-acetyltransferase [Pseudonocardiaceae bacterium]|nr:GNAT family N-acetyltransferase [Pseudonocardiaceae bacterium]